MPRYFDSEAEMHGGIRGWRGRNAFFNSKVEAHRAEMNSPEHTAGMRHRNLVSEELRLSRAIIAAEDHVTMLRAKLLQYRGQAEQLGAQAYTTGEIDPNVLKIRAQIQGLPDLIERAERELMDARTALDAHQDYMAAEMAAARADVQPQAEPVERPADPVAVEPIEPATAKTEVPRGRGRPPKVTT